MKSEIENWYALVTRSRFEKKCEKILLEKNIIVFLPTQKVIRQWSDRKKEVELPLFPGYIFVKIDINNRSSILNTDGIARIIRFNGVDTIIPEKQIEAIKIALSEQNIIEINDIEFYKGQNVNILSGPFKGFKGKLVRKNNKGKFLITIDSIGKGILVEIGSSRIEKII